MDGNATPTGTWKVVESQGDGSDADPAVVWRDSERDCEAWILGRGGVDHDAVVLCYGVDGPYAPVPLTFAVLDRMRPPGPDRVVERHADRSESEGWIELQRDADRRSGAPGDYEVVEAHDLDAALAAPAIAVRRGDAVRAWLPAGIEAIPDLRRYARATVARTVATPAGAFEVRAYPDGHVRVAAGGLVVPGCTAPPLALRGGVAASFEATVRVEEGGIRAAGMRYEIRDADAQAVDGGADHDAFRSAARSAVGAAVNAALAAHPLDREEALERHLDLNLARLASEEAAARARVSELARARARNEALLRDVRAALCAARAAEGADAIAPDGDEAPAPFGP